MTCFLFAPAKKPSPEHGDTGEGAFRIEKIYEPKFYMQHIAALTCSSLLLLHAARYSERCGYCRYD